MKRILLPIIFLLAASCSNSDDNQLKVTNSNLELTSQQTFQITHNLNSTEVDYSSDDEYIADVSPTGEITARRIGTTSIRLTSPYNNATIRLTVKPRNDLYAEPVTDWGLSRNDFLDRYGFPDATNAETNSLTYYIHSKEGLSYYIYYFVDGKLTRSGISIESSLSKDIAEFLSDRYKLFYVNDKYDNLVYINALEESDATLKVTAQSYNLNYWMVEYEPMK